MDHVWRSLDQVGARKDIIEGYHTGRRPEVLQALGRPPGFALDIGCGAGGFGSLLKERYPECTVWGVELNPDAAAHAAGHMDRVFAAPFDSVDWRKELPDRQFDTVFLLDVLEHMYNPWRLLESLNEIISPDAQVIISIPNTGNVNIFRDLATGYWKYDYYGPLDITHIRFFTTYEAVRMMNQTGYRVNYLHYLFGCGSGEIYASHQHKPFPQWLEFDRIKIEVRDAEELGRLCARQLLFRLTPAAAAEMTAWERQSAGAEHPACHVA